MIESVKYKIDDNVDTLVENIIKGVVRYDTVFMETWEATVEPITNTMFSINLILVESIHNLRPVTYKRQ